MNVLGGGHEQTRFFSGWRGGSSPVGGEEAIATPSTYVCRNLILPTWRFLHEAARFESWSR
jgi:hypothetical protein